MTIKNQSAETLTPKTMYNLTKNPSASKLSDVKGTTLAVEAWAIYESENDTGDISDILAVVTAEGEIYRTNSAPFIRDFVDITVIFPDVHPLPVTVESGRSKAGREFIYAVYAGE